MLNQKLNALLANYEVMYHKLQTFHWYVYGPTFFADHAQLETYYEQVAAAIDGIAETMLMIGEKPTGSMKGWLKDATIKEAGANPVEPKDVYTAVKADFETLLAGVVEVKEAAEKEENHLVDAFADDLIAELSKNIWMIGNVLA